MVSQASDRAHKHTQNTHLKSLEYSTVESPRRMHVLPPCLKVCFNSSGSRLGSSSSPAQPRATIERCMCDAR